MPESASCMWGRVEMVLDYARARGLAGGALRSGNLSILLQRCMRAGRGHGVPLSKAAIDTLEATQPSRC
jgi:hypothetical protein